MRVLINSKRYELDNSLVIGTGGEATVFDLSTLLPTGPFPQVGKIWHQTTPQRAAKLRFLLNSAAGLSLERVVYPLMPIYDYAGSDLKGFTMRKLEPGHEPLASLMKRSFRAANNVTTRDIAKIYLDGLDTLVLIIKALMAVGDLNDQNEMYHLLKLLVFYLDVDSFQCGPFPCMVGTEEYLCPDLYGIDLSRRPVFKPEHDHYSFMVLLFRALVGVHPYGGFHPTIPTLPKRALGRVPVWDPSVTAPKVALSFDFISDELMRVFERAFVRGERFSLERRILEDYCESLVECPKCHAWYPNQRKICPGCSAKTTVAIRMKKVIAGVKSMELIVTTGKIIFYKVVGEVVYCLVHERGQVVLYTKNPGQTVTRREFFRYRRGARYDVFSHYLVVCPEPVLEDLEVYDLDDPRQVLLRTTTEVFGGGHAIFGGARENLYRIAGSTLLHGEIMFGNQLVDRTVLTTMRNQTWLVVSPNNKVGDEMVLGFHRVIKDYLFFLMVGGNRFEVAVASLEEGERLIETSVRFASDGVLLLRKTRQRGVDHVRIEVVDRQGKVVLSRRQSLVDAPLYAYLHGKAYSRGVVLHATDDGVVQEKLDDQHQITLDATAAYVDGGDALIAYSGGILVVKEDRILLLTMS